MDNNFQINREYNLPPRLGKDLSNIAGGYILEQFFSTFNILPFCDFDDSAGVGDDISFSRKEAYRADVCNLIGVGVGVVQDLTCIGLSAAYLSGGDSRLATIAAGITGFKILTNVGSLTYLGVRRGIPKLLGNLVDRIYGDH